MSPSRATEPLEMVSLGERLRWMLAVRIGILVASGVLWAMGPGQSAGSVGFLLWPAVVHLALSLLAQAVSLSCPKDRRIARAAFGLPAIGDGVLLAWVMYLTGGVDSEIGYLVMLHIVAVTLLASFRTGLKIALWHSLVIMVVLEASAVDLLPVSTGASFDVTRLALYLGLVWTTSLMTAAFAAVNERELRRRRYDEQSLRQFGLFVHAADVPRRVAETLLTFVLDELGATRSAVWVQVYGPGDSEPRRLSVALERGRPLRVLPTDQELDEDSLIGETLARDVVLARPTAPDAWLGRALPDARRVVSIAFPSGSGVEGALVFESVHWRGTRAQRRIVDVAQQAVVHAATALARAELLDRLKAAAVTDGLTGVANRRAFDAFLEREISYACAGGSEISVILVDLDHFKRVNDLYGHLTGDDVLRATARALQACTRTGGLLARYGGEEFGVVLPGVGPEVAASIAERYRRAMHQVAAPVPVTGSLGVASLPDRGAGGEQLLARADRALYAAKERGRDCVVSADSLAAEAVHAPVSAVTASPGRQPHVASAWRTPPAQRHGGDHLPAGRGAAEPGEPGEPR